jgi:hypothetical protein
LLSKPSNFGILQGRVLHHTFPKLEDAMQQRSLIPPESIPPRAKYEKLFENLPEIPSQKSQRGRPPIARSVLLKGLIYRNLRGIDKLVELEFELLNNPSIAEPLGLRSS